MFAKKSLGLGLLIGLLAMAFAALPAMASAAPQLTDAKGSVAVGETVSATSINAETRLDNGAVLTCEHVVVSGIVTVNNGSEVDVSMDEKGGDSATGCELNGALPVVIEPTLETILLTATSKTASFSFAAPGLGLVETSTSNVIYTPPATTILVEGRVGGSAEGDFSGDFTVSDSNGAVTVD